MKNNYNLILMRHAAYQDGDRILTDHGGSKSGHLTPFGIIQSILAAKFMMNLNRHYKKFPKVTGIFTSDAVRSVETADVVRAGLASGNPVSEIDPKLAKKIGLSGDYKNSNEHLMPTVREKDAAFYDNPEKSMKIINKSVNDYDLKDFSINGDGRELGLAIVHEPFLEKLLGKRGKDVQHTAGFIVDAQYPVESAIAFKTTFNYDATGINNEFHSTMFGRDILGQNIAFWDVMQRAFDDSDIQKIANNYRQMHYFATQADMDKFTKVFPRNNLEMNHESLAASFHFEHPVIGAPWLETQKDIKNGGDETLPDGFGRIFLNLFLKDEFKTKNKTSAELELMLNEFRYKGK